jgi:Leucine-rich repeat (LRR) protein
VNFEDLKQLYLGYNNISDIKVFEKANFDKLEILYLNENKIDKKKSAETISYLKSKIGNFEV